MSYRLINILQAQKNDDAIKSCNKFNRYIQFVEKTYQNINQVSDENFKKYIINEYENLINQKFSYLKFINIGRPNLPNDHLSRDFDFSPQRIDTLIKQGVEAAQKAIFQYKE